jgi:hypothetical protein
MKVALRGRQSTEGLERFSRLTKLEIVNRQIVNELMFNN